MLDTAVFPAVINIIYFGKFLSSLENKYEFINYKIYDYLLIIK